MTYVITFYNADTHKIGTDVFTAISEKDARKDFRECYRHGKYRILSVVEFKEELGELNRHHSCEKEYE